MWIKLDCEIDSHPKARLAGFWGMVVTIALWRICKKNNKNGILLARHYDIDYLAEMLRAESYKEELKCGLMDAISAGFFTVRKSGVLEANDWEEFQGKGVPYRQRQANKPGNDLSDEPKFENPRTQKMYTAIRKFWPDYPIVEARETAVRLSGHFSEIDIPKVMSDAAANWRPGRTLNERSGLHGYIFSFFQTERNRNTKQNSGSSPKIRDQNSYQPKPYQQRIKENEERPVNKASPEEIGSLLSGAKFKEVAAEKDAEAEGLLASVGITKPEGVDD